MDPPPTNWTFIVDKNLKKQSIKLNFILTIVIFILILIMFVKSINIYINNTDGYITNNDNILKKGGFNLNYLVEQNYFKTLTPSDQKKYLELDNAKKLSNVKKHLIDEILK